MHCGKTFTPPLGRVHKRLACEPGHAGKKRAKPWPQNVSKVCLKICVECYKYLLNYRS